MSDSSLWAILLGRHTYSESPEIETGWCRVCLLLGFIGGCVVASFVIGAMP